MSYITGILPSRVDTSQEWALGTIGQTSDGKLYKYMQWDNGSAVAAVAGEVAYYYTLDGYKNNQVTSDVSDSVGIGAGVIQAVMTDGQFGWFQIKGVATLTIALTAGADGNALTAVGADDGTLDVSGAVTDCVCAFAGDASDNEIICAFPF
tara:strand:- start:1169 stop:1621 length:453 start_codon:yes stop_codon:yes gene_type:complete